jgi:hypothetical protein
MTIAPDSGNIPQESRNLAALVWVGTIFFGFIPGLVVYLLKKDDPYVSDQGKEALNWSITAAIGTFAGFILMLVLIGFLVLAAVGVCNLVFGILGAVACSNGSQFRAPFALRLIK